MCSLRMSVGVTNQSYRNGFQVVLFLFGTLFVPFYFSVTANAQTKPCPTQQSMVVEAARVDARILGHPGASRSAGTATSAASASVPEKTVEQKIDELNARVRYLECELQRRDGLTTGGPGLQQVNNRLGQVETNLNSLIARLKDAAKIAGEGKADGQASFKDVWAAINALKAAVGNLK